MTTFFAFAFGDGMAFDGMTVHRTVISVEKVRDMVAQGVTSALNPSHEATIHVMQQRYGIFVEIPEKAPLVKLAQGDRLIVMSVRGLPRREGGKGEYTQEEVAAATFEFSLWEVADKPLLTHDEIVRLFKVLAEADRYAGDLCYPYVDPYGRTEDAQFLAQIQRKLGLNDVAGRSYADPLKRL